MEIKTEGGYQNVAGAGTTSLGIIGTVLGSAALLAVIHKGRGLFGGNSEEYATKSDLAYTQELAQKDSEIALLKSEQNTEVKIADVYERVMTRVNADQRAQADWNASQSVANAQMSSAIATNSNSIATLQAVVGGITKVIVPKDAVCPEYMNRYNSWTAPTTPTNSSK